MPARPTTPRPTPPDRCAPRPAWPYPDVVRLYAHPSGQWCRKYTLPGGQRRPFYFGVWADPDAALNDWRRRDAAIRAGADSAAARAGLPRNPTLRQLCKAYLDHTAARVGPNGIAPATYRTDRHALRRALDTTRGGLDPVRAADTLTPADFARLHRALQRSSPHTAAHVIGAVSRVFTWAAADHGFPAPLMGSAFRRPSKASVRRHDTLSTKPVLAAWQVRALLAASRDPTMRACILLGVNCGMGASDIAEIPAAALIRQLGDEWGTGDAPARIVYPRAKTAIIRATALWPETIRAIVAARDACPQSGSPRPRPRRGPAPRASAPAPDAAPSRRFHATADLLLRDHNGAPLVHESSTGAYAIDNIAQRFRRLVRRLERAHDAAPPTHAPSAPEHPNPWRGVTFYRLRHTFGTVANIVGGTGGHGDGETRRIIMGQLTHALDQTYVREHGWHRIDAMAENVRRWVFSAEPSAVRGPWSGVER